MKAVIPLLCCLLAGCQLLSSTRLEPEAVQPGNRQAVSVLLLAGPTTDTEAQAVIEQAFARRLQRTHSVVLASVALPAERQIITDDVMARLKEQGMSHVLSVQLLSMEADNKEEAAAGFSLFTPERVPGARVGWQQEPWETGAQPLLSNGGPAQLRRVADMEVRLYDVATAQPVWRARARTLLKGEGRHTFDDLVTATVRALRKDGWL